MWSEPAVYGEQPVPRDSHSCTTVEDNLFIFGGTDGANPLKDLHIFYTCEFPIILLVQICICWYFLIIHYFMFFRLEMNICLTSYTYHYCLIVIVFSSCFGINITASNRWSSPRIRGEGPMAREGHTAVLVGKRIFIYGGCSKSSNSSHEEYFNDLHILNTGELHAFQWKVVASVSHKSVYCCYIYDDHYLCNINQHI